MFAGEDLLSIEVTTRCNLNCLHCFVQSPRREISFLSLSLVQDILKEGYEMGYRRLHLTGGEPLLWKRLSAALDDAFSLGYASILINTNGTLLSKDICSRLGACNRVSISVSLDGSKESHDHIRGCGQYERTLRGVANALDAGISTIVFTIMYRSLLPQLPVFTSAIFNEFPSMSHICVIPLMNTMNTSFALSNELLAPNDFIRLIRGISLLNMLGSRIDVLNEPLAYVAAHLMQCPLIQWTPPPNREKCIIPTRATPATQYF
jgi:MoaA/NifB/PqqE/SkfB family radical SAM enzyme